jgi:tetratricopeptide (TPR) repeat protein/TolB-like protein
MPPELVGPYRIRRKLGAGGMGEVYLADDTRLRRPVALKGLTAEWARAAQARRRLMREARAIAALNHPNIAAVYDVIEPEDTAYIVMEYVPGESLAARTRGGPQPPEAVAFIGTQLADALAAAHAAGLVHRDLKPGNIMMTPDGKVKVLDFGLARSLDAAPGSLPSDSAPLSDAGGLVGTPAYIPPEGYRGEPLDERSDIYSAGVVLYELLTGVRPFRGDDRAALARAILQGNAPPPRSFNARIPAALEEIVTRAMSPRREDRPASAAALGAELARIRSGDAELETATAPGLKLETLETPVRRLLTPVLRHPTRWTLGVGLVALAGGVGLLSQVSRKAEGRPAPTVVVLPFREADASSSIGAGLSDMLVTALAKVPRANVIGSAAIADQLARNPRRQGAARDLGADFVVDGAVQRSGDKVLVTLSLVNAASNVVLWSDDYEGTLASAFEFQRTVATTMADALRLRLTPEDRARIDRTPHISDASARLFTEAQALLERSDDPPSIKRAIELFTQVAKAEPTFALAQAGLGQAYWALYELTNESDWTVKARDATLDALRLDADQPLVRLALARIHDGTGRADEAIAELRRVIADKPDSDEAHAALGRVLARQGHTDDGVGELRKAIAIRPNYWKHYDRLGLIYLRASRYREAEEAYSQIVRLLPESSWGYQVMGTTRHAAGDREGALRWYHRALEIQPDNSETLSNVGFLQYESGDYEKAAVSFAAAVKSQPREAANYRNLADAYVRLGRTADARKAYTQAAALVEESLKINPSSALEWSRLGVYRAKVQDCSGARAAVARSLELAPGEGRTHHFAAAVFCLCHDDARAVAALRAALDTGYSREFLLADDDLARLANNSVFSRAVGRQQATVH